jgi:hypothetical protein
MLADGEFLVWTLRQIAVSCKSGVLDTATTENMQCLVMKMRGSLTGLYDYQFQVIPFCCMPPRVEARPEPSASPARTADSPHRMCGAGMRCAECGSVR